MNEIVIAFIENFSWPLVILIIIFLFKKELLGLVSRLKSVKAGSLEVLLGAKLHTALTKEQLEAIPKLTTEEIDLFLLVSFSSDENFSYSLPPKITPEMFRSRLMKINDAGLIVLVNPENSGNNMRHNVTKLGSQVRDLLLKDSIEFLRDAA